MSGGGEGQVRVWDVTKQGTTSMKEAMKEHKGKITCIKITVSDEEVQKVHKFCCGFLLFFTVQCVTSSTDGTCILWDLV